MTAQEARVVSEGAEVVLIVGGLVLGADAGKRLGQVRRLPSPLTSLVASILCFGAGLPLWLVAMGLPASPSPTLAVLISIAGGFLVGSAERLRELVDRSRASAARFATSSGSLPD